MCRLFAITGREPMSPMVAIDALEVMREGHDGSGVGIFMRDLGGPFEDIRDVPILSGIFTEKGIKRLDEFMMNLGFLTKYRITIRVPKSPPEGVPKRDVYLIRAYDYPDDWEEMTDVEKRAKLPEIRLRLRELGERERDMIVFSFWPDVIMFKEIGDPLSVAEHLQLARKDLQARVIMAQGRQNTNYEIDLYACHPFFLEGFSTMTNGENTAFIPIKEYLTSRGFSGYAGYQSDSEVFTHILHFTMKNLGLGLEAYKHVVTPLQNGDIETHADARILKQLKHSCRPLIIDGPNCVIGSLPDHSLFMLQDRKKLRPGVVGGHPGKYAFSSEICGLDAVIPDRDKTEDFQPMHLDTVIVDNDRREVRICRQTDELPRPH